MRGSRRFRRLAGVLLGGWVFPAGSARMCTVAISKKTARRLERLAAIRQRTEALAEEARVDFLHAVEAARADGATFQEIGDALGISRERVHQLLRD
jgi:DNA-directed RNA polymerase sigma subunit (sigma70/sigma32)